MIYEMSTSQRGGVLLFHLNFIYNKGEETLEGTRWRCQDRTCLGFLFINLQGWIDEWDYHSHGSMAIKIEKLKILAAIKERALSSTERANDIIVREISKIEDDDEVMLDLPHIRSMRDSIRRSRNSKDGLVPGMAEDIPEILKYDSRGDIFLRFDQGVGRDDRFVIFFSKLKLDFMKYVTTVLIDGTFRSTPQGFYQVLVIHGSILGNFYPLCYILLRDKSQVSYERSLRKFVELSGLAPRNVVSDFEQGLINGITSVFGICNYNGCLFHFGQAVWKRVSTDKKTTIYKTEEKFNRYINYIMHLAFVPTTKVIEYYLIVKNLILQEDEIERLKYITFLDYIERNWVGKFDIEQNKIKEPRISIEFWNVYERIKANLPRTSNAAESWNRTLNLRTEVAHPNIAQFLNELLNGEEAHRYNIRRAEKGIFIISKEDTIRERSISICIDNFLIYKPIDYLKIIGKYYKFKLED